MKMMIVILTDGDNDDNSDTLKTMMKIVMTIENDME